jgi:hypothetical protein
VKTSEGFCKCQDGYFLDSANKKCIKCTFPCISCFGSGTNQCAECNPLYLFTYYPDRTVCGDINGTLIIKIQNKNLQKLIFYFFRPSGSK